VRQVQPTDSTRPLFRFPTTIRVITADSVVRDSVMVLAEKSQTFDMRLPSAPLSFRFDEGGWLLGSVHTDQTPAELAHMAEHDLDTSARNWALYALASSQDTAAVDARRFIVLNERMPQLRAEALRQMAHDSTPQAITIVRSALRDPDASVRSEALLRLASLDSTGVADTALAMYHEDISSAARATALGVYGGLMGAKALGTVIAASGPSHTLRVRMTAAALLPRMHAPSAVDALEQLTDPVEVRELRMSALRGLFASGDTTRAIAVATRGLKDYDPLYSQAAVRALGQLGTPAAKAALETALKTETRVHVKAAIEQALSGRMHTGRRG
jgi:HEAT repeat protein